MGTRRECSQAVKRSNGNIPWEDEGRQGTCSKSWGVDSQGRKGALGGASRERGVRTLEK